jgi:hypothetical protein
MKKIMLVLIILASLIPGILAVVQYYENKSKETLNEIKEKDLNLKIDNLKVDNNELKKELKLLIEDNSKLSHKLTETALQLNNNVVGNGDLEIKVKILKNNEFNFKFFNVNDLPVNNASIFVINYNDLKKCDIIKETDDKVHIKFDCYINNIVKYNGINFNPNSAFLANDKIYLITNEYSNFSIQISTRKKTTIYYLVYKIIEGELLLSYRKYNYINMKEIFVEEINPLELDKGFWAENFYLKDIITVE